MHALKPSPRLCVCVCGGGGGAGRVMMDGFTRVARARAGPAPFFVLFFFVSFFLFRPVEPAVCFTDR